MITLSGAEELGKTLSSHTTRFVHGKWAIINRQLLSIYAYANMDSRDYDLVGKNRQFSSKESNLRISGANKSDCQFFDNFPLNWQ